METEGEENTNPPFYRTVPGATIIAASILAFATIIGVILTPQESSKATQKEVLERTGGVILSPYDNEKVTSPIAVAGLLQGIAEGQYIWLAVQFGNLLWLKQEVENRDTEWLEHISETGDSGNNFDIILLKVDQEGHLFIQNWFTEGDSADFYPGLERVPGSRILDVVPVRLK